LTPSSTHPPANTRKQTTLRLNELRTANDLLDDTHRLAARDEHGGSLLVQGALESTTIADITDEAASALRRCGEGCLVAVANRLACHRPVRASGENHNGEMR
jgi:hypothetical protein